MVKIWNEKLKDILIRAFKTFIQGFIGAAIVFLKCNEWQINGDDFWKTLLIAALSGGISAVMNLILHALDDEKQTTFNMDTFEDEEEGVEE